jgi:hypothetical protein
LRWKHITPEIDKETGKVVAARMLVYAGQNGGKKKARISAQAYNALIEWMD